MSPEHADVERAIRAGIHDAYRYGIGYCLEVIEQFKARTHDEASFEALLAHLRHYSANLWTNP